MALERTSTTVIPSDDWLEAQCRQIEEAGKALAATLAGVNARHRQHRESVAGRRPRLTASQIKEAQAAYRILHEVQVAIQEAVFDCEHDLRDLREREISPAEMLVDGDRLIIQYRFLRRRARILDALLAYLPAVSQHAFRCVEHLERVKEGAPLAELLAGPDCGFALIALEELQDEEAPRARRE